ncbi:MAG: hypothetical protein ACI81L_000253 [Verrucomicrobiales bacterium]
MSDGILSEPIDLEAPRHSKPVYPPVAASMGVVIEHRASGTVGAIVSFKPQLVVIRDRHGRDHNIVPRPGAFMVDGSPITLRPPTVHETEPEVSFTASGSVDPGVIPARMARASRIWVEGIHDAELIEKVWGDDLRVEGVVVEQMEGADDLVERVSRFGPRSGRRVAVLLDHLIDGSKESRIASQVSNPDVLIVGHPYVDVWQTIRPEVAGIEAWPTIPMGTEWKKGVMAHFGATGEPGIFWKGLLSRVSTFRDLEIPMVGAVEQMIDFVTAEH